MKTLQITVVFLGLLAACGLSARPARHPEYEPDGRRAPRAENLFLNARATAKDQWSDRAPALAVNGNRAAGDHWASDSLPAWHQVDMGREQTLASIRVVPYWPDGRIYGFKVEASRDGKTWTLLADQTANSICRGAEGFLLDFPPVACRYVRTTFTRNSANHAGHLVEIEGYAAARGLEAARLLAVSPRRRFARDTLSGLPAGASAEVKLRGWRGERVQAQVLVESPAGFEELRVEPCTLNDAQGREIPVRVETVRYTLADGELTADILEPASLDQTAFKGVVRPLLLSVDIPADAPASASGTLTVRLSGRTLTAPMTLAVDNLRLPPPAQWACHLDFWQHPDAVARWHDVPMWSPEHFALLLPQMKRLADMGQKTITATLIDEAWNEQTYDRFRGMIAVTRRADGSWAYDYTAFDRWVSFMRETVGLRNAAIHCYTMVPWSLTFPYYDEAQGKTLRPKLQPGSAEYEAFWGPFLSAFTAHLREKGWEAQTRIAMDERPDRLLKPALALARKYAPGLKIVAACNAPSQINADFADVSYGYDIAERLFAVAGERRAQGKLTTFYVCCNPVRPNTFMASNLAESEWLLPFAAHCGLDGLLRWAYHSWVENPLRSQDYTAWPSGDTSLVYPGNRSSLRLEALRNGIETFEKIRLLRQWAQAKGCAAALEPLEAALKRFTVARGKAKTGHLEDLEALDRALETAADALR